MLFFFLIALTLMPLEAQAVGLSWFQDTVGETRDIPEIATEKRGEIARFYALRGNRSLWNLKGPDASLRIQDFIRSIGNMAAYHGLNVDAYPLEKMRELAASSLDSDRLKLEHLMIFCLLTLAHDLHGDSVSFDRLYAGWTFRRQDLDIPSALNTAFANGTLQAFFERLAPQQPEYASLAAALAKYSAIETEGGWPRVAPGPSLWPQTTGPRVAQLRARLAAEGYNAPASTPDDADYFDERLEEALIDYQSHNGLLTDGHAGGMTQEALNTPVSARIAQIRANMERWRHMPEDFPPSAYVSVNIPDFSLSAFRNGIEIYYGRIVGGRTDRRTPFIESEIYNVVINPSWHVPLSIARKDILPKLRRDPYYLERQGVVIAGREDDPSGTEIDWQNISANSFNFRLRQVPGDFNSLGQLKFNFRNPFDVYMHGTPHQELFDKDQRAFSSGCVRLEDPIEIGEIVLEKNNENNGWSQQRILDEIDKGRTKTVNLAEPMPLFFLYWSVFPGDGDHMNFRKDIYGYDALLMEKIKKIGSMAGK